MGRPTVYSQEMADKICERLTNKESLSKICRSDDMPAKSTVCRWLAIHPAFRDQYACARAIQADEYFDETIDIADDGTNDYRKRTKADGSTEDVFDTDHVQRSKLRVDTRKWAVAKLDPKKYGEKLDLTVAGTLNTMSEEALNARIADLLAKAGTGAAAGGTGETEEP
ncbi:terminase small subunit protein [Mesorhizobium sp. M0387]|uniref:terminase small subunit-like protein n=1 Tax=Mesorhizobium sp. M0387 TaxID=2956940 RepID=UPI00333A9170